MTESLLPASIDYEATYPRLTRRLRLGVVGGGRIARTQASAARLSDYWDVVAGAFSSDAEKSRAQAANWYVPQERCYDHFAAMAEAEALRDNGIDAVMITTPNHLHQTAASAFIEAGIAVLCDKPLSNTREEAQALVQQVERSGQVFGVSYVMSCYPMVRQARVLAQSGAIGRINQIHAEFMQDWMVPESAFDAEHVQWRIDPERSGPTSCTGDIATHAAHLATFVSGLTLTQLRADMHVCGAPQPLEDTVFMSTRYDNHIPGTLIATRLAAGNRGGLRLRLYGSEGGLEWDMEHAEYLKFSRYGEPDRMLSRGYGHGIDPGVERMIRTGRGFPEGIIEAWANLYTEFALKVATHHDQIEYPHGWLLCPDVFAGAAGVDFIDAVVQSHSQGGQWVDCQLAKA